MSLYFLAFFPPQQAVTVLSQQEMSGAASLEVQQVQLNLIGEEKTLGFRCFSYKASHGNIRSPLPQLDENCCG